MKDKIKQQLELFYEQMKMIENNYIVECESAAERYKSLCQDLSDKCVIYKMALDSDRDFQVTSDFVEVKNNN